MQHRIKGDIVELSWTLPDTGEQSASTPEDIKVLRATQFGEEISCEKCPLRFTVVAEIPIDEKASQKSEPGKWHYSETIKSGHRYFYKVIVFDEYGIGGKDSKVVRFDHRAD